MTASHYPALSGVKIDRALINEIKDDEELTAMASIIEGAQLEAWFQDFGSDWDKARFSAYLLRPEALALLHRKRPPMNSTKKRRAYSRFNLRAPSEKVGHCPLTKLEDAEYGPKKSINAVVARTSKK